MKIKMLLNEEREGNSILEEVIALPMQIAVFLIALIFLLLMFSYINFQSLSTNIAQDLNFRQSGLAQATSMSGNTEYDLAKLSITDGAGTNSFDPNIITVNSDNNAYAYKRAVIYSILKNKNKLGLPYSHITNITVDIDQTGNNKGTGASIYSNSIIKCSITYDFCSFHFFNFNINGIPVHTSGYSVAT